MRRQPYLHLLKQRGGRFDAFFALSLESIGVRDRDGASDQEYFARLLNRQVDFIATLPAIGDGNAIELRFASSPVPDNPNRGRVAVALRVRVSAGDREAARGQALDAYQGLWPNLASISESYNWVAIHDEKGYEALFGSAEPPYLAELLRREAIIQLDRVHLLPPRRPIGFHEPLSKLADPSASDSSVYVCFPFKRNVNSLERLFDTLLMQPAPVIVSVALSPTKLTQHELDSLLDQILQGERYLNLPIHGQFAYPTEFVPPMRTQAKLLIDGLQRQIFGLRDDCFLCKIQIASHQPLAGALIEAVGVEISGHVHSAEGASDEGGRSSVLAGGYDWAAPQGTKESRIARNNFAQIQFTDWADTLAPLKGRRLRHLTEACEAGCAFRLPLPVDRDFPGIDTRLSRAVPPPVGLPEAGLFIGENIYRGLSQSVRLTRDDRRRHMYIVGQTGTGKSSLLLSMIAQDIRNGEGVGVLDPHGQLIDKVLRQVPRERIKDIVYINPEDDEWVPGLNALDYRDDLDKDAAVNHMLEIFDRLYDMRMAGGPVFEQYFRNSLLLAMSDPNDPATLVEAMRVFTDESFRNAKLAQCADPFVQMFWRQMAIPAKSKDWSLADMAAYVTSKFSRFVYNALIRPIALQQRSTLNFLQIMNEGRIVLVDLCKGKLGETNSAFLGMILIGLIQRAAFARPTDSSPNPPKDFYLYVDEFQNLATDSFSTILSEARKYRLNLILTNQYLHQIPENIREAVLGNAGTLLSFRVGMADATALEEEFLPLVNRKDLVNLPNYHAYLNTLVDGEATRPFNIVTRLVKPEEDQSVFDAIRANIGAYSRPRSEVMAEIESRLEASLGSRSRVSVKTAN